MRALSLCELGWYRQAEDLFEDTTEESRKVFFLKLDDVLSGDLFHRHRLRDVEFGARVLPVDPHVEATLIQRADERFVAGEFFGVLTYREDARDEDGRFWRRTSPGFIGVVLHVQRASMIGEPCAFGRICTPLVVFCLWWSCGQVGAYLLESALEVWHAPPGAYQTMVLTMTAGFPGPAAHKYAYQRLKLHRKGENYERPYGSMYFRMDVLGRPAAVVVLASSPNPSVSHQHGLHRYNCVDLARICRSPDRRDESCLRAVLRLSREYLVPLYPQRYPKKWSVVAAAIANSLPGTRSSEVEPSNSMYRFDGWERLRLAKAKNTSSGKRGKPSKAAGIDDDEDLIGLGCTATPCPRRPAGR